MKTLEIFDPAMCCSTGVCGVEVDPVLVQFNADLQWLAEQGVDGRRATTCRRSPQAFAANPAVLKEMEAGMERLPLTLVIDGAVVATGAYLSRAQLAQKLGLTVRCAERRSRRRAQASSCCCSPSQRLLLMAIPDGRPPAISSSPARAASARPRWPAPPAWRWPMPGGGC